MEDTASRTPWTVVALPLALTGVALVLFEVYDAAESLLAWLGGAIFLFWAVLGTAVAGFQLVHRAMARHSLPRRDAVLLAATLILVATVVNTHPLWGSGSGRG